MALARLVHHLAHPPRGTNTSPGLQPWVCSPQEAEALKRRFLNNLAIPQICVKSPPSPALGDQRFN